MPPHSEHPPASVRSLWRLKAYLRPHVPALAIMLGTALGGVGLSIAIPLVTKALIDGPITNHEIDGVLPLGLLALGLGVLEAVLIFWRRWVQSNAVLSMETRMRHDLYARLQELPMSFHSKWESGQLLSRVDDRPVRDPPVQRVRAAVPGHQHPPGHRRHDRAAEHVLAARPGRRLRRRSGRVALDAVREGVRRAVPPRAGRAGRPGHPRRGGRGRHPRDQGLRPQPAHRPTTTTGRRPSCAAPAWRRSVWPPGSGPSSR